MPEEENTKTEGVAQDPGQEEEEIRETGSLKLTGKSGKHGIRLLTIIGEIEGHEAVSGKQPNMSIFFRAWQKRRMMKTQRVC